MRLNVLYMTNVPAPYRIDFFNELGKKCNLTVTFDEPVTGSEWKIRDSKWFDNEFKFFKGIYLKHRKVFNIYYSKDIVSLIKNNNYDIIIVGNYSSVTSIYTMHYLKKKKIKFIINSDGGFPKENENFIIKKIKTFLIKQGNYYLTSGDNGKKYLKYYGANENYIYEYPFSSYMSSDISNILTDEHTKKNIKEKLGIMEDKIVLSVGQFVYRKGFDVLINACVGLSDNVGIYIIGGEPISEYIDLCKKNNLKNVHFIKFVDKTTLKEYFKIADVFSFPTRNDIWGFVVCEALTFGVPVITTKMCGAGLDLVKNNYNGYIVDVEDYLDMHNKISEILSDNEKKKEMSENAFNMMKDFTIEEEAIRHIEIFNKIIQE